MAANAISSKTLTIDSSYTGKREKVPNNEGLNAKLFDTFLGKVGRYHLVT